MLGENARILLGEAGSNQWLAVYYIRQYWVCMCYQGRVSVVEKQAVDLDTVGLDIVGLDIVGLDIVGLDTVTLYIVDMDAVDQRTRPVSRFRDGCARKGLTSCSRHADLFSLPLTDDVCGGHPGKCWGHAAQHSHHVAGIHAAAEEAIVYVCVEHDAYPHLRWDVVALVAPLLFCLFLLPKVFPLLAGPDAGLDASRQWSGGR